MKCARRTGAGFIATRNGIAVPLSQIARLNYEHEEPILWRRNRDIFLTARGDIVDNVQAPDDTNDCAARCAVSVV